MGQVFHLRRGVHLAAVGDDLVTLDIHADAYGILPGFGGAVGTRDHQGRIEVFPPELAEALADAGLLASAPEPEPTAAPPALPTRSVWRTDVVTVTTAERRRMAWTYLRAAPRLWRYPFAELIAGVARERPPRADHSLAAIARDARAFDQLLPAAPFQGECLFRSFLLLAFLRAQGRDATWVFAVQTYPFQAHCWLQVGDSILDDAAERVCGFSPILAV